MRCSILISVTLLLLTIGHESRAADAKDLLAGVVSSREKLFGTGELQATFEAGEVVKRERFSVEFDGASRRFASGTDVNVFDGEKLMLYNIGEGMNIRDPAIPDASYCFDIRLLGLTTTLAAAETLETRLELADDEDPIQIIKEAIDEVECNVIFFRNGSKQQVALWIDSSPEFRVYKSVITFAVDKATITDTVTSEFSGDSPLPSKTHSQRTVTRLAGDEGELAFSRGLSFEKFKAIKPDGKLFTINSLGMEPGLPVTDIRIHQRIGYWDGKKLVDSILDVPRQER